MGSLMLDDPLRPGLETPTDIDLISRLTRSEREERVKFLIAQADEIVQMALDQHQGAHRIAGTCVLFSGGNDSTVLAHLMRKHATHAVHCNTTIGIEETRQFVRDVCKQWGLPLLEEVAPVTYRELVLDQGFPGAGHHFKMFQRLKERGLRQARRKIVTDPRKERVLFLAGRRRQESARRANIPLHEREGSTIWASPIALWTKPDMATYRLMNRYTDPVPLNEVSEKIHMSGECLCGSFAKPGELEEIGAWFPEVKAEIEALEAEVRALGKFPEHRCKWGHGKGKATKKVGSLCTSCQLDLFEEESE
jgi:3'-phosphoadenosine 5'-phosphosulfate sulfotransferase (PAPS reductase)/FAD synthetase